MSDSGISWATFKSAPCSRQITTPAPHRSVFTGRMPFVLPNLQCKSTESVVAKQEHNLNCFLIWVYDSCAQWFSQQTWALLNLFYVVKFRFLCKFIWYFESFASVLEARVYRDNLIQLPLQNWLEVVAVSSKQHKSFVRIWNDCASFLCLLRSYQWMKLEALYFWAFCSTECVCLHACLGTGIVRPVCCWLLV